VLAELRDIWEKRGAFIASTIINAVILLSAFFIGRYFKKKGPALYAITARAISPHLTQLLIGSFVVAVGFAAHWFKGKNQHWYGRIEVLFGIVSAFSIAVSLSADRPWLPQGATLVGCAYVIARGMNNMSDAKAKLNTRTGSRDRSSTSNTSRRTSGR
jgi:hypothetical protein